MKPPIAHQVKSEITIHGQTIADNYSWLRDANWPQVTNQQILDYLKAENDYTQNYFAPLNQEKEILFNELKGRIKLADQSPYTKLDQFYYYTRTNADSEYPIYCRKMGDMDNTEEVLLDVNKLAKGNSFTRVTSFTVSPNHKLIAYGVDFTGDEKYTIFVYDTMLCEYLPEQIPDTLGNIVWHEELRGFFYTPANQYWRNDKVMFHHLGEDYRDDVLVYHEKDELYQVSVTKSRDKKYALIEVKGHGCNEWYSIPILVSHITPKLITPRQENIFYSVETHENYIYSITNRDAKNFHILRQKIEDIGLDVWETYVREDPNSYLKSFDVTIRYIILNYRQEGLPVIKIRRFTSDEEYIPQFPDPVFEAVAISYNYHIDDIRINYTSLVRPNTHYRYNDDMNNLEIVKEQEIPSGFNPSKYIVERIWAESEDTKVPVTVFYKKSLFKHDGMNPLYLYGYGSYGYGMPVSFRNFAVSLVDRGFVFAIAHIRGGDDLGHDWYEAAKFLHKKRTFTDFINSAKALISKAYTSKANIVISGGSAGGMLIGNVINQVPELFKAAIAHVPFVDVLNTMLDETLPLTPGEFKEWGNPKDKEFFDYIKSYSPYDNVLVQNYPNLFVTAGLSDPRVGYWEAAKWVAKLRAIKTDDNILLLKTNMDAGHAGASGRFDYLYELVEELNFIFKAFNIAIKSL